ncbi:unnamed protein product [Symbiodinium pilosum]|uniref:Secreted protein n=1 Tax=Symbiodinium pilosum TaxID=2952 RepID=A0A812N9I9_SYMPI|nr:unnamed protein product [Symbiodinium pilosum]
MACKILPWYVLVRNILQMLIRMVAFQDCPTRPVCKARPVRPGRCSCESGENSLLRLLSPALDAVMPFRCGGRGPVFLPKLSSNEMARGCKGLPAGDQTMDE